MRENDGRDLEIHRPDANSLSPKRLKLCGGQVVEWKNPPIGKESEQADEPFVVRDLPMYVALAMNRAEPAAHLFLRRNGGGHDVSIRRRKKSLAQRVARVSSGY